MLLAGVLGSTFAFAQTDVERRESARSAAEQGLDAFDAGRFEEAVEQLKRAEGLYHAPVHLLFMAQALERLGRWTEARDTFQKLVDERLPPDAHKANVQYQQDAAAALESLKAKLPQVEVVIVGAPASGVKVALDGQTLSEAALGAPIPLDPGKHELQASAVGLESEPRSLLVSAGARERVELELLPSGPFVRPTVRVQLQPAIEGLDKSQSELRNGISSEVGVKLEGVSVAPGVLLELQDGTNTLIVTHPADTSERWVRQRVLANENILPPSLTRAGVNIYHLNGVQGANPIDVSVQTVAGYKEDPLRLPLLIGGATVTALSAGVGLVLWLGPGNGARDRADEQLKDFGCTATPRESTCPDEKVDEIFEGYAEGDRHYTLAAISGLVGGAVGLGAMAYALFLTEEGDPIPEGWQLPGVPQISFTPQVGPQSVGLSTQGVW